MVENEDEFFGALADAAQAGELKPLGDAVHRDGSRIAPELSVEDAVWVSMGRPRLSAGSKAATTKTWKVRAPEALDEAVHDVARGRGMSLSEYIRLAVVAQVARDRRAG
ncbi:hypothetical protein NQ038_08250 [Brevibacterium sp. 50QC2O2]|uniref:hypothetical protein n=1 Tax=Brevibacterium TaxID=1696 RepID=UPI00211C381F|nr:MULTISPECIES: hypothetical protein [unclassified Brevibacterium]MCQ9386245.1 hypothetical protein [Brevibacterium sp. 68QC2CO]MCQ9388637.1 hypothetical protein [Brevibacterium sp. 50QC2O2]